MPQTQTYVCGLCETIRPRDELLAKKISYLTLGAKGKTVRSRTKDWVCLHCIADGKDPDFDIEAYDSPGMRRAEDVEAMIAAKRRQARSNESDGESAKE
jgi:hypothetical protein